MTLTRWISVSLVALLWSPVSLAQAPKATAATRTQELDATIAELKASRASASPENQKILDRQIESLENAKKMQLQVDEANEKNKALRPKLNDKAKAFFTPVPAVKPPTWIPDTLTRSEFKDEMLKCPAGAKVFADETSAECRTPPAQRGGIPTPHGLALWFYKSTGKLKAQRFYEKGLLRWDVSYHLTGGRDSEALYDDAKPKEHHQNGLVTGYAPNGTIVRQAEYKSGVLQGWSKLWEDDGFPLGASRYENGKTVETIGPTGEKM
jgi:hypothetical protein